MITSSLPITFLHREYKERGSAGGRMEIRAPWLHHYMKMMRYHLGGGTFLPVKGTSLEDTLLLLHCDGICEEFVDILLEMYETRS